MTDFSSYELGLGFNLCFVSEVASSWGNVAGNINPGTYGGLLVLVLGIFLNE